MPIGGRGRWPPASADSRECPSSNASTGCTVWVGRYLKFSSFNNNYKGGCTSYYNTSVPGLTITTTTPGTTTTTVTKGKVVQ